MGACGVRWVACYDCCGGDDDALDTSVDRRAGAAAAGVETAGVRDRCGLRADSLRGAAGDSDLPGGARAADAADPLMSGGWELGVGGWGATRASLLLTLSP